MKEFKIEKVFEQDYFNKIQNYFKNHFFLKNADYDFYNSKRIDSFDDQVLQEILNKLHEPAKIWFNNENIVPTYAIFSEYSGKQAHLNPHVDSGPCTYTLDVGLYHKEPWPLIIEGKEYLFLENEAIGFYANDQQHWKPEFPDAENNKVGILLIHYVDSNHMWLTLKPEVQKLVRQRIKTLS
jgi:hypothetical protein